MPVKKIYLGGQKLLFALVSEQDFDRINENYWHKKKSGRTHYARHPKLGMMHRVIMNCPEGLVVHHLDGNGLNNTRENLVICTAEENLKRRAGWGKSKVPGVKYLKHRDSWVATHRLGEFKTEDEAATALLNLYKQLGLELKLEIFER